MAALAVSLTLQLRVYRASGGIKKCEPPLDHFSLPLRRFGVRDFAFALTGESRDQGKSYSGVRSIAAIPADTATRHSHRHFSGTHGRRTAAA